MSQEGRQPWVAPEVGCCCGFKDHRHIAPLRLKSCSRRLTSSMEPNTLYRRVYRDSTMELRDALSQISEIRQQMARTEVYRRYRALTVGFSGVLALLGALFQPQFVAAPEHDLGRYLSFWIVIAAVSALVVGTEVWWRTRRTDSTRLRQMTRLAFEQLSPSLFVGAFLTLCIYHGAPYVAWMLPGLWSLILSLGVFASFRLLPSSYSWVAFYYALCGFGCLIWGQGANVLSPWQMGISFGGGQTVAAAILYWTLERTDASQE